MIKLELDKIWERKYDWTGANDHEYLEYKKTVNKASIKSCNNLVNTSHVKSNKGIGNNGNNITKGINANKRSNDNTDKMPSSKRVKNDPIAKFNVNADKIIKKTDCVSKIQQEYRIGQIEAHQKTDVTGDSLGNKVRN